MYEASKSAKRRYYSGNFSNKYFVGHGIDIGGKPDPLGQYGEIFTRMQSVRVWDLEDGDAQYMRGINNNTFDFVHASHCLEHMVDVQEALRNWIRILKPGGYIIITVPDEDMYEQGYWPSQYNFDHKHTFTIHKKQSWSPVSINILEMLIIFSDLLKIEKIERITEFYRQSLSSHKFDQTATLVAECCIELICQKKV
jgi:ubiquinone/menaquinone biosynthesis C-methylase UbiE